MFGLANTDGMPPEPVTHITPSEDNGPKYKEGD
jgi:hypothetical protein